MKIGILSLHRTINDGSILQAYSLYSYLSDRLPGADIQIVDYYPRELSRYNRMIWRRPGFPFVRLSGVRKMHNAWKFLRTRCRVTAQTSNASDLRAAQAWFDGLGFDAVVVGSDTVWVLDPRGTLPAPPNLFFAPGQHTKYAASFAASCDPIRSNLSDALQGELREHLQRFQFLGVRDRFSMATIASWGVPSSRLRFVPDPTFFHDFSRVAEVPFEPPAGARFAIVAIANEQLALRVAEQLRAAGYRVLDVVRTTGDAWFVRRAAHLSLEQRIGLYRLPQIVVTDRFHGSIFAATLGSPILACLEDAKKWPLENSKLRDLYERLGVARMLYRVEPEQLPADLIRRIHADWAAAEPTVGAHVDALRKEGADNVGPLLRDLQNLCARPPEVAMRVASSSS